MRTFEEHNPIAVAVYFLCVSGVGMLCMDPAVLALSLAGAVALHLSRNGLKDARSHLFTLLLFLVLGLVNPLISHNGVTVLFVVNDSPITLEALLYGFASAGMLVAVLYWFRSFSQIMTSDRLLHLFGALSPRLALIFSMALRYVPLFGQQLHKTRQAQTALGLYREDSLLTRLRGELRVASVMITWALENGVITADSMTSRGYGIGRRTQFSLYRFTWRDALLTFLSLTLAAGTLSGVISRTFTYYPAVTAAPLDGRSLCGIISYALLTLLPLIINGKEALRWRCLQSRI